MIKCTSPKIKPLIPLLLILCALFIAIPFIDTSKVHAQGPPAIPQQFYGTVTNSGSLVGAGYSIVAKTGSTQLGSSTTDSQGRYGYSPLFRINANSGELIEFYVNGVKATQRTNFSGGTVTQLNLTVTGAPASTPPASSCGITTASLPACSVGTAYSAGLAASGGSTPYTWSVSAGTLPAGSTISSISGVVSGTPTTAQTYNFTVQANDSAAHFCSKALSIVINSASAAPNVVTVSSSILGVADTFSLSNSVLASAKDLASADGRVKLSIAAGTAINMQGLTQLGAATESNPPAATDNSTMVRSYSFMPSGATFSPTTTMTLKYETASLPAGATEANLYIAWWTGSTWERLTSTVNTTLKEVSAPVAHFTVFSLRYLPTTTSTATSTTTTTTTTTDTTPTTPTVTAATTVISTNVLNTSGSFSTSGGAVSSATSLSSSNGKMSLSLAANTAVSLPQGSQQVTVIQLASPPAAPADAKMVEAYAFGPDNATFAPALTVTVKYDPASLPSNVTEANLYIALLENSAWTPLASTVNTQAKTVTAQVSHFSVYGLLGKVTSATPVVPEAPAAPATTPAATPAATPDAAGSGLPSGMSIPVLAVIIAGGLLIIVLVIILIVRQRSSGY